MATRSTIAMKTDTGYSYIYCHYDGYTEHNGRILLDHYTSEGKIQALIALGSLSYLAENVCHLPDQAHSWASPAPGVCVAYHRDRGDNLCVSDVQYLDEIDAEEYNYVWENGSWRLWKKHDEIVDIVLSEENTRELTTA